MEKEGRIYEAISNVMNDIGAVGKNSKNEQQKFMYRGIDAVMNALNPAMVKHKVFVAPEILEQIREERQSRQGATLIYSICKIRYRFYTTDGSYVDAVTIGEGMDSGDKATNKAMAIAFKYACFQTFCIPTEEMANDDPDKTVHEVAPKAGNTPVPSGIGKEEIENLNKELARTGVEAATVLNMFGVNTFEEMTPAQYTACMNKFKATPTKE